MSAAERARRHRQRQRELKGCVVVEVDFSLIDALIECGLVQADRSEHRPAIAKAIGVILARWKETVTRDASSAFLSASVIGQSRGSHARQSSPDIQPEEP